MNEVVNLTKGESVNLTKAVPTLKKVYIGAGWDEKQSGATMDADLSLFTLNANNQVRGSDDFIYFGNLKNNSGSVVHHGDNLTGEGEGDDEVISVNLEALDPGVTCVAVYLNIYQSAQKGQSLADIDNAHIRIVDEDSGKEISRYDINEDLSGDTLYFGELNRTEDGWTFTAKGETRTANLSTIVSEYGLQAAA